ncbi:pseudaminic acid cytidylyltransferase [Pseudoalteromonas xiamenensis]|uniref:pseudaminic acid cytidylyltransferase n=1 Tax=Pseudoalteromonas xiamenensis TaxID=882626 RepID=UPI0027E42A48|nr:pseudaminic acid cytidylyltransferase [Pseudoalteromonas xiamenensis]WMN61184.1 pseudaminic acid cytidylyltransferase [Pseudoalteromonas xiamenensis]
MNIAIIPARAGSKRIPRKNIKAFHGAPIIFYSIKEALESGCFDKVIVSTDDREIAEIAAQYGAEVPFIRPSDISDDYATTLDVIQHAVKWYLDSGYVLDKVCCIYATAPFVSSESIKNALSTLNADDLLDYVFSATSYAFPIQRALFMREDKTVQMFQPENFNSRSQDLPEAYHDAGQFYWGTVDAFLNKRPIFGDRSKIELLPRKYVQDIDTPEDWELAEALFKVMKC